MDTTTVKFSFIVNLAGSNPETESLSSFPFPIDNPTGAGYFYLRRLGHLWNAMNFRGIWLDVLLLEMLFLVKPIRLLSSVDLRQHFQHNFFRDPILPGLRHGKQRL